VSTPRGIRLRVARLRTVIRIRLRSQLICLGVTIDILGNGGVFSELARSSQACPPSPVPINQVQESRRILVDAKVGPRTEGHKFCMCQVKETDASPSIPKMGGDGRNPVAQCASEQLGPYEPIRINQLEGAAQKVLPDSKAGWKKKV
jgi:hypothetical protein